MSTASSADVASNGTISVADHYRDPGLYFVDLATRVARVGIATDSEGQDIDEDPTELNTINTAGGFLVVSTDKLSVKYTTVNLHDHDVGVVQANKPAPEKRLLYYFEMYVKNAGTKGYVAIGFTGDNFKMRRQPGWEENSCGYHGDNGFLYRGPETEGPFGPTYSTNDIVGAGINYARQEFFFTKNGDVVGVSSKDIKGPLFPTVSVHSQNEEVEVNFGQKPFAFDLKKYEAQERMKLQKTIEKVSLPTNVSYGLVRSYLLHYGYAETLNSFDIAGKSTIPPVCFGLESASDEQNILHSLNQRTILRQLIRNGDIDTALGKLQEWYPRIIEEENSATCFVLRCQKFIELVRIGALEEAVKYGRVELARFFDLHPFCDLVQKCVALLAYEEPRDSSVGYLLNESQREIVADTVNAVILFSHPNGKASESCFKSPLERLLAQLSVCSMERRSLNGDQGEAFQLQRVLGSFNSAKC